MPKLNLGALKNLGKLNKNIFLVVIAVIAIAVTAFLIYSKNTVSAKDVVNKSIDYLNKNLLQAGQTATLINFSEESGVVKFNVKIAGQTYTSYATKDGKLFFPQAYDLTSGSTNPTGQNSQQTNSTTGGSVDISKVKTNNEPYVGSQNAPVTIAVWTDYQCPFCKQLEQSVIEQLVKDYVNNGKLKIVFKDYPFLGADSTTLGLWGRAVWQVAPGNFYQWHDEIFNQQGQENSGWATQAKIMQITTDAIGAGDAAKVSQLVKTNATQYQQELDADKAEGTGFGINGTPGTIIGTQLISGAQPYATFTAAIDALLK